MPTVKKCKSCIFFKEPDRCIRYPPQGHLTREYPTRVHYEQDRKTVPDRDACGEYQKK